MGMPGVLPRFVRTVVMMGWSALGFISREERSRWAMLSDADESIGQKNAFSHHPMYFTGFLMVFGVAQIHGFAQIQWASPEGM